MTSQLSSNKTKQVLLQNIYYVHKLFFKKMWYITFLRNIHRKSSIYIRANCAIKKKNSDSKAFPLFVQYERWTNIQIE